MTRKSILAACGVSQLNIRIDVNIETRDGYILASYHINMKPWVRLFQKLASRTMANITS